MTTINRRAFLATAGALASSAVSDAHPARSQRLAISDDRGPVVDVVIVGGGVSGVYCAWRLATAEAPAGPMSPHIWSTDRPSIALFEASDRIGGRLWSFEPPGMPHLRADLGGSRLRTNQRLVMALLNHLRIETIPFGGGDSHNLRYLRGRRFRVADLHDPEIVPYDLPERFRGKTDDEIALGVIEHYIPHASQLTETEWDQVRRDGTHDGVPLHDFGFRYLIQRVLPEEAYLFVRDGAGFDIFGRNANAADMMYRLAAGAAAPRRYVTPSLGMEEIPHALARMAEQAGVTLHRRQRVRRIVPEPGAGNDPPLLSLEIESSAGDEITRVSARHVILALPPRAISLFDRDSLPLSSAAYDSLHSAVLPIAAGKSFLGYDRPWWHDLGITAGATITDLPLKMTYYFGSEAERPGANPSNHAALLMASTVEGDDLEFWSTFRRQDPSTPGGAPYQRPEIGLVPEVLTLPESAVKEMQRQLRMVHGRRVWMGEPTMAAFADWSQDPFGAGYHVWAAGATAWEMTPIAREPAPGIPLSICGEAWSSRQGWVEGALMTAERVLQDRLGLGWPTWLSTDVDLGP